MIQISKLFCICCNKTIDLEEFNGHELYGHEIKSCMSPSSVVDEMVAGFGSRFDTSGFAIAICDDCMQKALNEKRAVKIYDGFRRGYDFDEDLKELINKQYE